MAHDFDAVVVGSGFGGGIAALRLAEAGKSVLVLERGRRWQPGEFPRDVTDVDNLLWRYPARRAAQGLYELRFHSAIATVTASGVGGGSLIYANILVRPDAGVFDDRWPAGIDRTSLAPYFDRVAAVLKPSPVPADLDLPKRAAFRAAADELGVEAFDPDQTVNWDGPESAERQRCRQIAECEFGCPFGAKNTIDLTYLAEAEARGARVVTNARVLVVEPVDGGYRVVYEDTLGGGRGAFSGSRVVLAAGTLGTAEILFRSREDAGSLPNLSWRLGHGYSANGDFFGTVFDAAVDLEPWRGPDVTTVMRFWDRAPEFTLAAPSFNRPVTEVLASLAQPDENALLRRLSAPAWWRLERLLPLLFAKGLLSRPLPLPGAPARDPARVTNLFAIGRDNANGMIRWKRDGIDIEWNFAEENGLLVERESDAIRRVGEAYGGTVRLFPLWELFGRTMTVHSLGGCRLSESPDDGVVSPDGEVHGYPGLFVADGSVVPGSIGFHPALTIAALAERISERAAASFSR